MGKLTSEIWKSPIIQRRFQQEACFETNRRGKASRPLYCVCVPDPETRRGCNVMQNYPDDSIFFADPHPAQCSMAAFVSDKLNRNEHHDGLWVVGWTHPPTVNDLIKSGDGNECWGRLIMLWLDEDGDPQFTVESDNDFTEMIEAGDQYYVGLAAEAWTKWDDAFGKKAQKSDFGLKEHEIKKEVLESLR